MPRRLRFTGENPPIDLWKEYPNWRNAYEEEGFIGQDETTLMPDEVQTHISAQTAFTCGKVIFNDGREFPAFLAVFDRRIDSCDVYEGSNPWRISYSHQDRRWLPYLAEWLSPAERPPAVTFEDTSIFPLRIQMTLPWKLDHKPSTYEVTTEGFAREVI